MRRGMTGKEVITSEIAETANGRKSGGQIIGINLGWDFCAEHERGIKSIKRAFGIPEKAMRRQILKDIIGADARTVTKVPRGLQFFEDYEGYAYLIYMDESPINGGRMIERFNRSLEGSNEDLETSWAEYSRAGQFGIRIKNDFLSHGTMVLGQIYEAFRRRDAMIFLVGSDNPFARAGLVIAVRSRVPEEWLVKMKEADEDQLNLKEAAEKTGIEEKLKAAGKHYFALSPRWASSIKLTSSGEVKTAHSVVFWLNPWEQLDNNSGWYTVEDLEEWIRGEGPIPKTATRATA